MRVDVTTQIDINRPRPEVAAFAANPDNATTWYEDIKAVRWETPRPVQVGSRIAFEAQFLGRKLAYTYVVRELEPGVRLVMSTDAGPFPMETTYSWQDTPGGGTHMKLRNRGQPSGFANLAAPIMSAQVRRATTRNLALLKAILEGRQTVAAGAVAGK
jgi:Polyketide cyclase / dehydrase and lipid transport